MRIAATIGFLLVSILLELARADFATAGFAKSFIYKGLRIDVTQTEKWIGGIYPDTAYRVAVSGSGIPTVVEEGENGGEIEKAWVTDLDKDNRFEVILVERDFGTGNISNLLFFEWTGAKLLPHSLPPPKTDFEHVKSGASDYEVKGETIIRKFALSKEGDPLCCPTGGTVEITYVFRSDKLSIAKSTTKRVR